MINIHYAFTTCNTKNNQVSNRVCGTDRSLLSRKSLVSLINAINYLEKNKPNSVKHTIRIFDDHSTDEHVKNLKAIVDRYQSKHLSIEYTLEYTLSPVFGQMNNYRASYEWLRDQSEFVFLVQDDFLFLEESIYESLDIFYQIFGETGDHIIVDPHHQNRYWRYEYKNVSTPRAVFLGKNRHWIQMYNLSCSFLTTKRLLSENWEYIEMFLSLPSTGIDGGKLEAISLNYMTVRKGILVVTPINTLAFHMQGQEEIDPYIDWKPLWEKTLDVQAELR
jgi:hypothetical protein